MATVLLNTNEIQESIDELATLKRYFNDNKDKYSKYKYSDTLLLSHAVEKVHNTISDIYSNINLLETILKSYKSDVEKLEQSFANNYSQHIRELIIQKQ